MDGVQIGVSFFLWGTAAFITGFFLGAKVLLNHVNEELKKQGSEIEAKWYIDL